MTETTWDVRDQGVILLQKHERAEDYHQWVVIPGWKGQPVVIRRDKIGRGAPGNRLAEDWLVLICNNTDCPARAAYRTRLIAETVESVLPVPVEASSSSETDRG